MTIENNKPNKQLLCGIRALAGVPRCEIAEAPVSIIKDKRRKWLLKIRLLTEKMSVFIPAATTWCVIIDSAYPLGPIDIYPDKKDGIHATFPHQLRNGEGESDVPWREGKICVESPIRNLSPLWLNPDPIGDADMRLRWYIERAISWIFSAATNELICDGDPFELPQYPESNSDIRIVHDEGNDSYDAWLSTTDMVGEVVFENFLPVNGTFIAVEFKDFKGNFIRKASFRTEDEIGHGQIEKMTGIWWRWNGPVVLEPWEVPATWKELRCVGRKLGVNVDDILRRIARRIRGKGAQILFIGYPIPLRKGETPFEMHWCAISISLMKEGYKPPNGFRTNETGWWHRDRRTVFEDNKKINYVLTSNWHPDRLQARGRMVQSLREMYTVIIGAGALGSVVAELLVRGGTKNIVLVDPDKLKAGNIVRHVLTMKNMGVNKAKALQEHLLTINPFVNVFIHEKSFPNTKEDVEKFLIQADLVIDCTASDGMLQALSLGWWSVPKIFVSLSLGFKGRRMFVFINDGNKFPVTEFFKSLQPWLNEEEKVRSSHDETLEGAGCWSPLFPARHDDIMLAAATAIKVIEKAAEIRAISKRLMVYEQEDSSNGFEGFRRVEGSL